MLFGVYGALAMGCALSRLSYVCVGSNFEVV